MYQHFPVRRAASTARNASTTSSTDSSGTFPETSTDRNGVMMSVSAYPGQMALTRTPSSAQAGPSARTSATTAALFAEYTGSCGTGHQRHRSVEPHRFHHRHQLRQVTAQ